MGQHTLIRVAEMTLTARGLALAICLTCVGSAQEKTEQVRKPTAKQQGSRTVPNSSAIEFVRIPAGRFLMGDLRKGVRFREKVARHLVQISNPFEMSKHEISVDQFRSFVDATDRVTACESAAGSVQGFDRKQSKWIEDGSFNWRSPGYPQGDRHPVVYLDRFDAIEFCKWLTQTDKGGRTYRLPTEAEWEYACRAGTRTRFSTGDDPTTQVGFANVADQALLRVWPDAINTPPHDLRPNDGHPFAARVGSFKPNQFGLCDMHGNVWEWCSDRYSSRYYAKAPLNDPTGPEIPPNDRDPVVRGLQYVTRGGSWVSFVADSSFRNAWRGNVGRADVGFRVVRLP